MPLKLSERSDAQSERVFGIFRESDSAAAQSTLFGLRVHVGVRGIWPLLLHRDQPLVSDGFELFLAERGVARVEGPVAPLGGTQCVRAKEVLSERYRRPVATRDDEQITVGQLSEVEWAESSIRHASNIVHPNIAEGALR